MEVVAKNSKSWPLEFYPSHVVLPGVKEIGVPFNTSIPKRGTG